MIEPLAHCRICGLQNIDAPWGPDGKTPNYEICPCCGVEAGYEDSTPESARKYRQEWLRKGAPWFNPGRKPQDWDVQIQIKHIPFESL